MQVVALSDALPPDSMLALELRLGPERASGFPGTIDLSARLLLQARRKLLTAGEFFAQASIDGRPVGRRIRSIESQPEFPHA